MKKAYSDFIELLLEVLAEEEESEKEALDFPEDEEEDV